MFGQELNMIDEAERTNEDRKACRRNRARAHEVADFICDRLIELGYPCTTIEKRKHIIDVEFFEKYGVCNGFVYRGLGVLVDRKVLEERHGQFQISLAMRIKMKKANPWFK